MQPPGIKERALELERQAWVSESEAQCPTIAEAGHRKEFKSFDLEALSRLKMRLSRVKKSTGITFKVSTEGNKVIATREE